jgi:hypothetical protein
LDGKALGRHTRQEKTVMSSQCWQGEWGPKA